MLFTKEGALQEKWLTGPSSGTRVFGPELSPTNVKFALLDCSSQDFFVVHGQYRRHGVALWAVRTLFQLLKDEVRPPQRWSKAHASDVFASFSTHRESSSS